MPCGEGHWVQPRLQASWTEPTWLRDSQSSDTDDMRLTRI